MIHGPEFSPNRVVAGSVVAIILYWALSIVVDHHLLRDVVNSLSFGVSLIIAMTWGPSAYRAARENVAGGEWMLILGTFLLWSVVMVQRTYVILYNWAGQPQSWQESAIPGFWPYCYVLAGLLFIAAPGVRSEGIRKKTVWALVASVATASLVAGFLIGASVSSY
ncbi:hypothetical protein NKH14_17735 [Mesorhizobium sp. M1380]|uniref:hypothetical protein n=1 Tax=Mesorhizobium sp. M1380 TaxID=2957093 RepID=UPI00333DA580